MGWLADLGLGLLMLAENVGASMAFGGGVRREGHAAEATRPVDTAGVARPTWAAWPVLLAGAALLSLVAMRLMAWGGLVPSALSWLLVWGEALLFARLAYQVTWLEALVLATLGYCLNHLCSDCLNLLAAVVPSVGALPRLGPTDVVLRYAVLAVGYLGAYLLVGRTFVTDVMRIRNRVRWIAFCCGALVVAILFQLVFVNDSPAEARSALFFYDALCTALVMAVMVSVSRADHLEDALATVDKLWEQSRAQYELTRENIELINIKCHDIRKCIDEAGARDAALSAQTVDEIKDCVRVYDSSAHTGSRALDVVLTDAWLRCSELGVELTCMADGSLLAGVAEDDLYFLMENVLSNALEAVAQLENPARQVVSLSVTEAGPLVRILVENPYAGELEFVGGLPVTSKEDRRNHGFGLKSIRRMTEKYGGDVAISARDGVFSLSVLLPRA